MRINLGFETYFCNFCSQAEKGVKRILSSPFTPCKRHNTTDEIDTYLVPCCTYHHARTHESTCHYDVTAYISNVLLNRI